MGVQDGIGWSVNTTPAKQRAVAGLLGHLINTMVFEQRKWYRRPAEIWVLDLTAGSGVYDNGMFGSPLLIAPHIIEALRNHALTFFVCCEQNAETLTRLRRTLGEIYPKRLPVRYCTDQREALGLVPREALGLVYLDPNGWNDLAPEFLTEISQLAPNMDVLFTRECGASLRMQGAKHTKHMPTITDYIAALDKKKRYIARYSARQNWALVFGSNWAWRLQGQLSWSGGWPPTDGMLYEVESDQGRALLNHFLLNRPDVVRTYPQRRVISLPNLPNNTNNMALEPIAEATPEPHTMAWWRRERGLTQMQIAVRLGKQLSTLQITEAGHTSPGVDLAIAIAQALGVTVEQIDWPAMLAAGETARKARAQKRNKGGKEPAQAM